MKSLRNLLIPAFAALLVFPAFAEAKDRIIFIDPKHDRTVPVYPLDSKGRPLKEAVTALIPGDFATLKEVRKDGWYVIRAKDLQGKDLELVLDPKTLVTEKGEHASYIAAANARRTKVGGSAPALGVSTPGLDRTVCDMVKDECHLYLPGEEIEVEDAVLALTTDGETPKEKWRNYYRGKNGWWLDSDDTERTDASWSMLDDPNESPENKEDCAKNPNAPLDDQQGEGLGEAAEAIQAGAHEKQLEAVLPHLGDCFPMREGGDYHGQIIGNMEKKQFPQLLKEMKDENGNTQIVHANKGDWVAMDVLARTLYGEMAGCFAKGSQYPETVAKVVLNRVDFNEANPKYGARFIEAGMKSPLRNDITNAVFKSKQFSVWNRGDKARRMSMCPPSKADQNYWKGELPTELEKKIWKEAVKIASEAVLSGQSFRRRTKDLKALYYTSNFEHSTENFTPIRNARISGKSVPLSRCVQLWSANDLKGIPGHGRLFHPLFRDVFYQVVGL